MRAVKSRTNICTLEKFDIFSDGKRKQGQLLIRQIKCSVKCVSYFSWGLLCITHFTEFPEKYFLKMNKRAFLYDLMLHTEVVVAMAPKSYDMDEMQSHK